MLLAGSRVSISCCTLAPSMRPSSMGTSCAWRDRMWISVRRFLYLSFKSCSASLNITLLMRRLPYTSVNFAVSLSSIVLAMMLRIGVMPDPAAKPTRCSARGFLMTKRPSGGITASVSPAFSCVAAQLENRPPSIGRMPTSSCLCWLYLLLVLQIE